MGRNRHSFVFKHLPPCLQTQVRHGEIIGTYRGAKIAKGAGVDHQIGRALAHDNGQVVVNFPGIPAGKSLKGFNKTVTGFDAAGTVALVAPGCLGRGKVWIRHKACPGHGLFKISPGLWHDPGKACVQPGGAPPSLCLPASRETPDKIRSMEVAAFLPWKACITGLCIVSAREPSFPANGLLM